MPKLISSETKREWKEYREKMESDPEFKKAEVQKRRTRAKSRDKEKEKALREAERAKKTPPSQPVTHTSLDVSS